MAYKVQLFFFGIYIIVGFLYTALGSSCYFDSDCTGSQGDYCCKGECSFDSCPTCTSNSDCSGSQGYNCCEGKCSFLSCSTCTSNSDCFGAKFCCSGVCRYECPYLSALSIFGIIVGVIVSIILTALVVSCLCCASCPLYHARRRGGAIIARHPYQNFQTATVTTSTSTYQPPPQAIAPPPYPGPSFSAYSGNPPRGDNQFSNTNKQYTGVTQYPGPPPTNYS